MLMGKYHSCCCCLFDFVEIGFFADIVRWSGGTTCCFRTRCAMASIGALAFQIAILIIGNTNFVVVVVVVFVLVFSTTMFDGRELSRGMADLFLSGAMKLDGSGVTVAPAPDRYA
jgi:hypothetical protein